jgi:hypothetical protein
MAWNWKSGTEDRGTLSDGTPFRKNYRSYFEQYKTERGATRGLIAAETRPPAKEQR